MGPETRTDRQRSADRATAEAPDAAPSLNRGAGGGALEETRRFFLGRIGGLLAGTALTAVAGEVTAQEPLPAPGASPATGPGLDKPMDIGTYTPKHGFLFDGIHRIPVDKVRLGDYKTTAPGGVLYAVALDLDKIGRDKIPAGHGIQISVVSNRIDPQTGEPLTVNFVIDPKSVPASNAVDASTFRGAIGSDKGLRNFVDALSRTNDPFGLGVGVRVSNLAGADKDKPDIQFQLITRDGKPATMTMQAVPLETK